MQGFHGAQQGQRVFDVLSLCLACLPPPCNSQQLPPMVCAQTTNGKNLVNKHAAVFSGRAHKGTAFEGRGRSVWKLKMSALPQYQDFLKAGSSSVNIPSCPRLTPRIAHPFRTNMQAATTTLCHPMTYKDQLETCMQTPACAGRSGTAMPRDCVHEGQNLDISTLSAVQPKPCCGQVTK